MTNDERPGRRPDDPEPDTLEDDVAHAKLEREDELLGLRVARRTLRCHSEILASFDLA